jgi:hypothetical protein
MTNVTHLFPDQERLNSIDALKSAIRQQLAAALGAFTNEQMSDKHLLFSLERLNEAAELIQAFQHLRRS